MDPFWERESAWLNGSQIARDIERTDYSPCTWRTQPLHIVPPQPYSPSDPKTKATLDWIFLVSSLNFSFWSDLPSDKRFGIEWRKAWDSDERVVHTGYWSLVAALNRGAFTQLFQPPARARKAKILTA